MIEVVSTSAVWEHAARMQKWSVLVSVVALFVRCARGVRVGGGAQQAQWRIEGSYMWGWCWGPGVVGVLGAVYWGWW